jgi:hypothetical protein
VSRYSGKLRKLSVCSGTPVIPQLPPLLSPPATLLLLGASDVIDDVIDVKVDVALVGKVVVAFVCKVVVAANVGVALVWKVVVGA